LRALLRRGEGKRVWERKGENFLGNKAILMGGQFARL